MSDIARLWARNLRGLNFAEHAVCRELAEYHVAEMDACFPSIATIRDIYECSDRYVKIILNRLNDWNLVTRVEWFEPTLKADKNRQTSNRYKLSLKQHFPNPTAESRRNKDRNQQQKPRPYDNRDHAALHGAKQGRRILSILANAIPSGNQSLMAGVKEAYLDTRAKTTYVTIDAEGYLRDFLYMQTDLQKFVRHETNLETTLTPVLLYYKSKKR